MKCLYVLFDANCEICRRCRDWLSRQDAYVPLRFVALQSPERRRLFPDIDGLRPEEQLLAIGDEGDVYRGASAWVMCLWALRRYRAHALWLSSPALMPLARQMCQKLAANRYRVSRWLFGTSNPKCIECCRAN